MSTIWIVINRSKAEKYLLEPFAEKYKVFDDTQEGRAAMLRHAKSIGWNDDFSLGISDKIGVATTHMCGDSDLMIMRLPILEAGRGTP